MNEIRGDLWHFHARGEWVVITTNGDTSLRGAVMGRGVAKQAALRFPTLPRRLGKALQREGLRVEAFPDIRVLAFPVKHTWRENANLALIARSAAELRQWLDANPEVPAVYLVRPGCGNGQLNWIDVRPTIGPYLDDRFFVVDIIPATERYVL